MKNELLLELLDELLRSGGNSLEELMSADEWLSTLSMLSNEELLEEELPSTLSDEEWLTRLSDEELLSSGRLWLEKRLSEDELLRSGGTWLDEEELLSELSEGRSWLERKLLSELSELSEGRS